MDIIIMDFSKVPKLNQRKVCIKIIKTTINEHLMEKSE